MAETELVVPTGAVHLRRPHAAASSPLRAWSAADQLVLEYLGTESLGRALIVNDEFGALTVPLAEASPTVWTDAALSRNAIRANLNLNGLPPLDQARSITGDQAPAGVFDTIVVRIPKTSALLEHQLQTIRGCATETTRIVGTGMVRHIHSSTITTFESSIGTTTTSLAKRKARLIHSQVTVPAATNAGLRFTEFTTDRGVKVAELPGTFSAGHLDVGTALVLDVVANEPAPPPAARIADLGCGNGVVAATLAQHWTDASFVLLDTSDLAVAAARQTAGWNDLGNRLTARAADGFEDTPDSSLDMVVTNPPFHQGHAVDRDLTDRLLADTARVLVVNGVAYVVVQRHLNLHASMKRWFPRVDVISKHPSHVVLRARLG